MKTIEQKLMNFHPWRYVIIGASFGIILGLILVYLCS